MTSKQPPSILLLTADEMNREALGCYGATSHRTPNLDRLAREGVRFDAAYTSSPVCLPARCSLATGLYPHQNLSSSNNTGRSLDRNLPNLFTLLKGAGYRTSMHGKCHFIPVTYACNERAFTREYEHFIEYYRSLGMDHLDLMDDPQVSAWYYDHYAKDLERQGLLSEFRRCVWECHEQTAEFPTAGVFRFPGPGEWHPDSWVGRKTVEHIESYKDAAPAFIWASFGGPHYPACAPDEYYGLVDMDKDRPRRLRAGEWDDASKYNAKNGAGGHADGDFYAPGRRQGNYDEAYWRRWRHAYYASCVQIDDAIGRIVQAAEARWGGNLLVLFLADHGDMMGDHGFWGKCCHDQGTRVPMIARFPGGEHAGPPTGALVQTVDVLPTFLQAAGAPPIPCAGRALPSLAAAGGRPFVLTEYEDLVMLADRRLKHVWRRREGRDFHELYDLAGDPDEFENVYSRRSEYPGFEKFEAEIGRLRREEKLDWALFYAGQGAPPWAKL